MHLWQLQLGTFRIPELDPTEAVTSQTCLRPPRKHHRCNSCSDPMRGAYCCCTDPGEVENDSSDFCSAPQTVDVA